MSKHFNLLLRTLLLIKQRFLILCLLFSILLSLDDDFNTSKNDHKHYNIMLIYYKLYNERNRINLK